MRWQRRAAGPRRAVIMAFWLLEQSFPMIM
jgi:hypothetical protein